MTYLDHPVEHSEQLELLDSIEARDERRQARLTGLGIEIGRVLRGKRRDSLLDTLPPTELPVIPDEIVTELGRRLAGQPEPLMDDITNNHHPEPTRKMFEWYVTAGNKNRKVTTSSDPEEWKQVKRAMQRQTQHITDLLMRNVRVQLQTARLYRAGLASAQRSYREASRLDDQAAALASSAIEDFGICLRGNEALEDISYDGNLASDIERVGVFTSYEPHTLLAQPLILRLVQIEAAKREAFWGLRYDAYRTFDNDRDRRTTQDKRDDESVEAILQSLR